MAAGSGGMFEDLLGDALRRHRQPGPLPNAPKSKVEKGVQIHGRDIAGTYYVRAEDVVRLLEANEVLPHVTGLLRKKLDQQ